MSGLLISFLGVDGIGKTSLAQALVEALRGKGYEVAPVSWRASLTSTPEPWPGQALQQLWLESYRCLFGAGQRGGAPVTLPRDFASWQEGNHEDLLAEQPVHGNVAAGPLAAAMVEMAGNVILSSEVIAPALRSGAIVVLETFPLKHVLKEIMVAEHLAAKAGPQGAEVAHLAAQIRQAVLPLFGTGLMRPDIGVLLDGPVNLAYRWRLAQSGQIGAMEDLGAGGAKGEESFHALQEATAVYFRQWAQLWGWLVHHVDDAGRESNVERGLKLILDHPALRSAK